MANSTFTIGGTTATFLDRSRGTQQEAGDLERLTLGISLLGSDAETQWAAFFSLVTTKYAIQVPLGGDPVPDVVNGPGPGTLVHAVLGTATAILIGLTRNTYLASARSQGVAIFLRTTDWA